MDQDAFRETYREVNEIYCAFEKGVLTNQCNCGEAQRFCIAEREGVHCNNAAGQARCLKWLELLREQARFALRTEEERRLLPHGKAIRLQVGGMRGLLRVLAGESEQEPSEREIKDINDTLARAQARFGQLEAAPFSEIMRDVASYQVRKRSRRNR